MSAPVDYVLHLADNALVLGQRNAEWCGHGPVLEEDIAQANVSLDLIGQARLLYQHAAMLLGGHATEDTLAYFRDANAFRNYTLLELPHHGPLAGTAAAERDYATTVVRNFLFSVWMHLRWESLCTSADAQLAAIAGRAVKEVSYHVRHSGDWLVRLGDGTHESHQRMQAAVDHLMPYTQEFWTASPFELAATANGTAVPASAMAAQWQEQVVAALQQATLIYPQPVGHVTSGKLCRHSEHLSRLLGDMQSLARQHPGATW